jgi:tetratricopeptide (TPR) repeat protein
MKTLKEAMNRTIQGEGGVVFLHGEAGIGKTRLARELRAYAHSQGMRVLYGRCPGVFKMDGIPPYVLWREVIRDFLDNCSLEQLYRVIGFYPAEVAKLVPELVQKLRAIPQSFPISPEQELSRLFEAVSQFVINIAREAHLLVVLDDLQWADPSSILLLHYLARGVQKTPLLLLGAYRSGEIDSKHPLTPVLAELNRERLSQSISLKRMSLDEISMMIRQMLEQHDVPAEFCSLVYEKTRGNPFFVEEVVKSLKEENLIYLEDNKWRTRDISRIELPETVKSVVKARIDRLDDECQKVLTMASLVGNDFTPDALQEVIGLKEMDLRTILDQLLRTGLLKYGVVHGEDICSFTDTVVRDTVYEEVGTFERKKLHGIVGTGLEKAYAGKIEEHFGELANHFLEAGDKNKALDYCIKAGEKAAKVYANGEAAFYLQSALRLLEEKEGALREKASVLETLGNVKKLVGEHDACIKCWNECLSCGKELCDNELVSRLHCKMANVFWENIGDAEKAKVHHEIALEILENEPETVALASLYEDIANQLSMSGETSEALPWAQKALDVAKRMNSDEAMARSCVVLGSIMNWAGNKKEGLEYCEKGLRIALDRDFLDTAVWAYNEVAGVLPEEETEKIIEYYEKGYALARKIGVIFRQSWLASSLASFYMGTGDMNRAVLMAEESAALDRKSGNVTHLSISLGRLGSAYQILGEWDKTEQYYDEALRISLGLNDFQSTILSHARAGRLYFEKGDYQKAGEQYEKMFQACENAGAKYHPALMGALIHVVWNYMELKEYARANDLTKTLHDFAARSKDNYLIAQENVLRGMLLRKQKKWKESIMQFESGIEQLKDIGANRWNVYMFAKMDLCEFARVYLERGRHGDKEKACSLINQALEIFQKIGAKKDIEKTMRLIEGLPPLLTQIPEKTVNPPSCAFDDLRSNVVASPRELKVGETLELEIEVTNARKEGAILLTKIKEIIPKGFTVVRKPESCRVEDNCLNMKEKRLEPSKREEVKLILTPKIQGAFHITPRIIYVDENGNEKTCEAKPISITVKELGLKGWLKGEI